MRLGLYQVQRQECLMCDQPLDSEERHDTMTEIALEGALLGQVQHPYHVCPQCYNKVDKKTAESPEWREKWDQWVKENIK